MTGAEIEELTPSQTFGDASSDSGGEELESELQRAFSLEEDEDDIEILRRAELRCIPGVQWYFGDIPVVSRWCSDGVPVEFRRSSGGGRGGAIPSCTSLLLFSSWLRSLLKRNEGLFIVFLEWHSPKSVVNYEATVMVTADIIWWLIVTAYSDYS
ncbi:hypothetical protein IEQ34_006693 [Dendrobium chrysotoxum]|uniref:Uncharacterized protein n=1 Tax=Dendrobium chrysotoxum TaxID=161865 RepID=A0AAV7H7M3_DENCH|nr:hypothetical protein IEQ34_006693 [Dendrobium chrysotoxum]